MSRRLIWVGFVWAIAVAGSGTVAAVVKDDADPADPYVEAMVEAAEEDEYLADAHDAGREAIECFSRAIVDALGVDVLEASGVTPRELAEADTLTGAGLPADPAIVDVLVSAAGTCELGPLMADALIVEFVRAASEEDTAMEGSDGARACVRDAIVGDPAFLHSFIAGYAGTTPEEEAFGAVMGALGGVVARCPTLVTEVVIGILEAQFAVVELAFSDGARACLDGQLAARPAEIAAAFGHTDIGEFNGVLSSALAACPDTVVELLVPIFEGFGLTVGDASRACLAREIAARPEQAAAAFAAGGGPESEAFGLDLGRACELELTGG
ncbi:MAG: hypothetical protein ACRD0U_10605 [Acidimicrobiales bacterium]